uniref:Uncharacterized protein n=1 Tax=Aureoumbra lagunensis TaxID=44058 RepID=A0A6S8BXF5_9STRA|mmetsp:Transcript_6572/g.9210  ORF Transcript_6572/g.9210 Transcript_6572/m.9210 type:complete len:215 (+) Transcript_6572:479-1123(+)
MAVLASAIHSDTEHKISIAASRLRVETSHSDEHPYSWKHEVADGLCLILEDLTLKLPSRESGFMYDRSPVSATTLRKASMSKFVTASMNSRRFRSKTGISLLPPLEGRGLVFKFKRMVVGNGPNASQEPLHLEETIQKLVQSSLFLFLFLFLNLISFDMMCAVLSFHYVSSYEVYIWWLLFLGVVPMLYYSILIPKSLYPHHLLQYVHFLLSYF